MLKTALHFFFIVLGGSLLASFLGGLFGYTIARISPEFIKSLFSLHKLEDSASYGISVGMIWGLFIGAAVAAFACALSLAKEIIRLRIDHRSEKTQH